jgi:hypothetical protein
MVCGRSGCLTEVMINRRTLPWTVACAALTAAMLWPAIANRFPIVFYDTGGYLDAYMTGLLANGRSALYGFFLRLGMPAAFWPNIVLQAAAVVWMLILTLRTHGLGGRPVLAALIGLALATLTSLPWYAAQLLPDIWAPLAVLAFYLLAFRGGALRKWEGLALGGCIAFAMASHMGTLGLMLGLLLIYILWALFGSRLRWPRPALPAAAIAVAAGVFLSLASNFIITGHFVFTPGGSNFLFGRLIQTGMAQRYVADHCPDSSLRICAYRDKLPKDGDEWLWSSESPLWDMGGWEAFDPEARRIVLGSVRDHPAMHLRHAAEGALTQMFLVKTGDYIRRDTWHTHGILEQYAPQFYQAFLAAPQQKLGFDFDWINILHVPVAMAAIIGLPVVIFLALRGHIRRRSAMLAVTVLAAFLGNAAICGALSNPHDRYQSRLIWLAPLALIIAAAGIRRGRKPAA